MKIPSHKLNSSKASEFVGIVFWKWNRVFSFFRHNYRRSAGPINSQHFIKRNGLGGNRCKTPRLMIFQYNLKTRTIISFNFSTIKSLSSNKIMLVYNSLLSLISSLEPYKIHPDTCLSIEDHIPVNKKQLIVLYKFTKST